MRSDDPLGRAGPEAKSRRDVNPTAAELARSRLAASSTASPGAGERWLAKHQGGLRAIVSIVDDLAACPDVDHTCRLIVELVRARLGIERCSVYLVDGSVMRGTWGTSSRLEMVPEHGYSFPMDPYFERIYGPSEDDKVEWKLLFGDRTEIVDGVPRVVARHWFAATPIRRGARPIGVMYNDAAISRSDTDPLRQDLLAVLCSFLGTIIEEKRAETELRRSRPLLDMALEASGIGTWVSDFATGMLRVDARAHAQLGFAPDELNMPVETWRNTMVHPDDRDAERWYRRLHPASDIVVHEAELRHLTKSGEYRWVLIRGRNLTPEGATEATQAVGTIQDITELRQAEERMRHAQKLESLGVLAGGIAHDFNNLLMAVLGNTSLAMRHLDPENPAETHIRRIESAALRAADLAKQMLAYSGQGRVEKRPRDLSELLSGMADLLEASVSKKVSLQWELSAGLPAVSLDGTQIEQVAMNLIVNGAEAIGDRPGSVRIRTEAARVAEGDLVAVQSQRLEPGEYVVLSVSDTGCGMTEEVRQRLFEPFYTTKFAGRGLGLSAVLGIVRNHGGGIRVESTVGSGSTFTVYLPTTTQAAEPARSAREERAESPHSGLARGARVLYAEDEPDLQALGLAVLTEAGFRVLTASDGEEALAAFAEHQDEIEVSVLDLAMPGRSGWEVLSAIRAARPDARVIVMSGYGNVSRAPGADGGGPDAFLHKPFRLSELVGEVARLVRMPGDARRGEDG